MARYRIPLATILNMPRCVGLCDALCTVVVISSHIIYFKDDSEEGGSMDAENDAKVSDELVVWKRAYSRFCVDPFAATLVRYLCNFTLKEKESFMSTYLAASLVMNRSGMVWWIGVQQSSLC